ncbi:hypothetical protein [Azospirillum argentinense]
MSVSVPFGQHLCGVAFPSANAEGHEVHLREHLACFEP